jgi:hypothetical protein
VVLRQVKSVCTARTLSCAYLWLNWLANRGVLGIEIQVDTADVGGELTGGTAERGSDDPGSVPDRSFVRC